MPRLKIIFIILFILLHTLTGYTQNFKSQLLVGLNVSQVDGDSYGGYNQPGILGGFSIYRTDNTKYNYGFEMLFSQKGSHKKTTEDDPAPFQLRYTYICIPVFIDLKNPGTTLKNVIIRVGISNNLKITSKVNFGYGWEKTEIRPWELSGIIGVGYKFNNHLGFMFRHENSLLSVGAPPQNQYYKINRRGLYNRLVSFVFSYEI